MSRTARLWAYLLIIGAAWGGAFPLIRHAAATMSPLAMAGARGTVAAATVALWLALAGGLAWPDRRMLRDIAVLGVINGLLPFALVAAALGRIEAAPASLIQAAQPALIALLAPLVLREERPGPRAVAGLALGAIGIAVVLGPHVLEGGATLTGALLMLGTTCSFAVATVYLRWARVASGGLLLLGQQLAYAVPALALALWLGGPGAFRQPPDAWATVTVLGVLATALPTALFFRLLTFARATEASLVAYLQPVFATLLAAALLGEWPGPRVLAGGATVLAGVWLASRR